jgi:hypothetical protein
MPSSPPLSNARSQYLGYFSIVLDPEIFNPTPYIKADESLAGSQAEYALNRSFHNHPSVLSTVHIITTLTHIAQHTPPQ